MIALNQFIRFYFQEINDQILRNLNHSEIDVVINELATFRNYSLGPSYHGDDSKNHFLCHLICWKFHQLALFFKFTIFLNNLFSILPKPILSKLGDSLFLELFKLDNQTFKGLHQKNEISNYFNGAIQTKK